MCYVEDFAIEDGLKLGAKTVSYLFTDPKVDDVSQIDHVIWGMIQLIITAPRGFKMILM